MSGIKALPGILRRYLLFLRCQRAFVLSAWAVLGFRSRAMSAMTRDHGDFFTF
jgi:hypothetical protein